MCAYVTLPPGSHAIAAQYRRDATYNSSASAALNIDTTVSTAPAAGPPVLDLGVMPVGGPAPSAGIHSRQARSHVPELLTAGLHGFAPSTRSRNRALP